MKIKNEANQIQNQTKKEAIKPAIKTQVVKAELTIGAGRSSVVGAQNFAAEAMKLKLQTTPIQTGGAAQPAVDPKQKADEILAANGGGKSEGNAENAGKAIAEIAKTDPALAVSVMTEVLTSLKGTKYPDNVASGFVKNLTDAELKSVAESPNGKEMLRDLQRHLTTGKVHSDERDQAFKIQRQLGETFSATNQGIDRLSDAAFAASYGDAFNTEATPEQAAAGLKTINKGPGDNTAGDVQAFTTQLEAHKNDPQWMASYFAALGTEKTAELIGNATNPSGYSNYLYGSGIGSGSKAAAEQFTKNTATIRNALDTLQKGGNLSQSDMDNLVNTMQKKGFDPNVGIEIFGKSTNKNVREMFINSAIKNGNDTLDAAASYVLSRMPAADQARILGGMDDTKLNNFIAGAMAGQKDVLDVESYLRTGMGSKLRKSGGINEILALATAKGGHPSTAGTTGFPKELQERLFVAVSKGLTNPQAMNNFKQDTGFKDSLSKLFINNGADILKAQAPDGAFTDKNFVDGMTKFFEMTLFTGKGGELRDDLMKSVITTMSNVGDASKAPPLSQAQYERTHNGWSQQDHVEVMGGLMGMVLQAASNQKTSISNEILKNEAARKEMIGFITGMAFCFVPGAGDILGKIAGEGATFLQKVPDKLINFASGQITSQMDKAAQDQFMTLLRGMNNNDALKNIDVFIDSFKQTVVATNSALPNGENGELNLRTMFQSAFAFYGDLVRF